jgi:hypothetical protein
MNEARRRLSRARAKPTFRSDNVLWKTSNTKDIGKMNIEEHIKDPHVIAAFKDMTMRGAAEFVLRDDGALLMIIRNKASEEDVLFKVTRTGLRCLARVKI